MTKQVDLEVDFDDGKLHRKRGEQNMAKKDSIQALLFKPQRYELNLSNYAFLRYIFFCLCIISIFEKIVSDLGVKSEERNIGKNQNSMPIFTFVSNKNKEWRVWLNKSWSVGIIRIEGLDTMYGVREEIYIFWFRRDLRLEDNAALFRALTSGYAVLPVFIFDPSILIQYEEKEYAQIEFIHTQVERLKTTLEQVGSSLVVRHCTPGEFFEHITDIYAVRGVYANEDYELSARKRDSEIEKLLRAKHIEFCTYKDQVVFSKQEIVKEDGSPYTVFTPYSKKWKKSITAESTLAYNCTPHFNNFVRFKYPSFPTLCDLGYSSRGIPFPGKEIDDCLIQHYDRYRNYPAVRGTSRLGVHLRFGTISIRELVSRAFRLNETFLNELIWREFYFAITWHFPHIGSGYSFKRKYDEIIWRNNEDDFTAWCAGKTGYPFVDAGMRELNATGFMHNRARMVAASFLVKHLLIDWRWGEAYFANRLLDFDFAANNGSWQWVAGSGCDAVPYFRIFNPELQALKFDKGEKYIRQWIPEIGTRLYPNPMVDHDAAKRRAIEAYQKALKE